MEEEYHRTLGTAVQWYDVLRSELEREVEASIARARAASKTPDATPQAEPTASNSSDQPRCSERLQRICPACFGGTRFGRSMAE